jgi:hypothetical protein
MPALLEQLASALLVLEGSLSRAQTIVVRAALLKPWSAAASHS